MFRCTLSQQKLLFALSMAGVVFQSALALAATDGTETTAQKPSSEIVCSFLLQNDISALARNLFVKSERQHEAAEIEEILEVFYAQGPEKFDGLLYALVRQPKDVSGEITFIKILFEMRIQTKNNLFAAKLDQLVQKTFVIRIPMLSQLLVEGTVQSKNEEFRERVLDVIEIGIRAGIKAELDKGNPLPNLDLLNRLYAVANKLGCLEKFRTILKMEYLGYKERKYEPEVREALNESLNMYVLSLEIEAPGQRTEIILPSLFATEHQPEKRTNKPLFESSAVEKNISADVFARSEIFAFQYVMYPAGSFKVSNPTLVRADESVTLTYDFEIQTTPVTQLQWFLITGNNPSHFNKAEFADTREEFVVINGIGILVNHPVENVSWEETQIFIQKLNQLDREYVYRLPYSVERERAARNGTVAGYPADKDDIRELGWFEQNSGGRTHAVAMKQFVNGLADMHGNVREWLHDWFSFRHYPRAIDDKGPLNGGWSTNIWDNTRRLSASSFKDQGSMFTSAHRHPPHFQSNDIGFRLVRTKK